MRALWSLYNIDSKLISSCSKKDQYRYAAYGGIVLLFFLISLLSVIYTIYLLTFDWIMAAGLGPLLAWNFMNLYRLTLFTINPANPLTGDRSAGNMVTILVRSIFLILLLLVVVKPLELIILEKHIDPYIEVYKKEKIKHFDDKVLKFFDDEINLLKEENFKLNGDLVVRKTEFEEGREAYWGRSSLEANLLINRIKLNEKSIADLSRKRSGLSQRYAAKIKESPGMVERLRVLITELPWSWGISAIISLILLFPFFVKRFLLNNDVYFGIEKTNEINLISIHYKWFKELYTKIFEQKYGYNIVFYEAFEDAPFNRIRKEDKVYEANDLAFREWIEKQM